MKLLAVCVGQPRDYVDFGAVWNPRWSSAIRKMPVDGPVEAHPLGLTGDAVANPEAHGGPDKAVLAYSADHATDWTADLPDLETGPGAFGENLHVSGQSEATVCLGDRYRIGSVELEVSHPRQPCWKLGRRHEQPDLPKRTIATHRYGWYLRITGPGTLQAGDTIELLDRPHPDWPIARVSEVYYGKKKRPDEAAELAAIETLASVWRDDLKLHDRST